MRRLVRLGQQAPVMLFGLMVLLALPAEAQRRSSANAGHVAGAFDYYQLVLSWSPTHCEDNSRGRNDTQCGPRRARAYAFVLHGLWPQYEQGYPENCRTRARPFVPNRVIDGMMDVMPSRGLIIHQYRKHGTCSGYGPADYFKASRLLYQRIAIPPRYRNPKAAQFVTPGELVRDFTAVNPKLQPAMISVICKRGNKNQLREVRVCFDKKGLFRACSGRATRHQCARKKMYVPPIRLGR